MTQPIPQGYKQTEIGVIPEDWEVSSLESVCKEIGDGIHSTPVYSLTGKFFFINGNNIDNGKITVDENTQKVDESEFLKHGKKLSDSSILLSINGTIGNLAFFENEQLVLGKSAAYLTVKDKFSKYFIYYSLQTKSTKRMFEDGLTGSTIKNLGLSTIRQTIIPIPKREEQTAIATALSDVDALISGLESLIAKKQAIKTATMQQLLTGKTRLPQFAHHPDGTPKGTQQTELGEIPEDWGVIEFGDCIKLVVDNRGKTPPLATTGFPMLEVNAVYKQGRSPNLKKVTKYVSKIIYESWFRDGHPNVGDILVVTVGSAGETSFVNNEGYCIAQNLISLRVKNGFDSSFIYYLTTFTPFKKQVEAVLMGAVQPSLKVPHLKKFRFSMSASKHEQTAIAQILSDMDEEIQTLQTRLSKTQQIKQGMMQQLLTGKVRLV